MAQNTTPEEQTFRELYRSILVHFPDKSTRWLLEHKENVRGLIEITANHMVEFIDFSQLELQKRSFLSDTLQEQESDLLYSVPFKNGSKTDDLIIYILVEHQSTVDASMSLRLLSYMTNIWLDQRRVWTNNKVPKRERQYRPFLPIVLYTGDQPWQTPVTLSALMNIPEVLEPFVPKFEVLLLSVKEVDTETLIKTDHPFGWLLTVFQQEKSDKQSFIETMDKAITRFKTLAPEQRERALHYLMMFVTSRRPSAENQELRQIIQQNANDMEVDIMAKTMADVLIERGDQQGYERGREQGEFRTKQDDVIKLLTHRFPDISDSVVREVHEIQEVSRLDTLFDQLLTATTFDDIDLNGNQ